MNRGSFGLPKRTEAAVDSTAAAPSERDLVLWLRADTGVVRDGSDRVSRWSDVMGRYSGEQSTGSAQPLLVADALDGHPVIRFDGGDSIASLGVPIGLTDYTVFAVIARAATTTSYFTGGYGTGSDAVLHVGWSSELVFSWDHYNRSLRAAVPPYLAGQYVQVTAVLRQGYGRRLESLGWLVARSTDGQPLSAAATVYYAGAGTTSSFTGDIAEILIYTRALTAPQRRAVEAYLVRRYPSVLALHCAGW